MTIFGYEIGALAQHITIIIAVLGVGGRLCFLVKKIYAEHKVLMDRVMNIERRNKKVDRDK